MPSKQYKILAVDDEKFNLLLLQSCLKGTEYSVETCSDALQALTVFKRGDYDVVLLDIVMEGIDGFEARDLIRVRNPKIPIIFLTSLLDDINSTMINRITADKHSYYLNKSFNRATLIAKIEEAVRGYRDETEADQLFRQIDADLALAGEVQRIMMPGWCVSAAGMVYAYLYEPAFRVSGDLFEFFELPDDRALFVVGDIAGHGVQAALYMTALQSFLKATVNELAPGELPEGILNRLNDFFFDELNGANYMTCLVALFDFRNNVAEFHNAGHPQMLRCSPGTGEVRSCDPGGSSGSIPIGWKRGYCYSETENVSFRFEDDEIFLLYTDGVLELAGAAAPDQVSGETEFFKLAGALAQGGNNAVTMPFRVRNAFRQLGHTKATDDILLLAVRKFVPSGRQFAKVISPRIAEVGNLVEECGALIAEYYDNTYFITQLELLLSEFLNNVILYGFAEKKPEKNGIAVKVELLEKHAVVEVSDRGRQWSNPQQEPMSPGDELEHLNSTRATSGRGLAIIRSIATSIVRHHFSGINQTIFTIPYPAESETI